MKKLVKQVSLVLTVCLWWGVAQAYSFKGKVVGVSDGDTITVMREGAPTKVRLLGIDCPEKKQAYGTRAKQFTAALVFGKVVEVQYEKEDRYGRILGNVKVNTIDLSEALLRPGLAWHYRQYSKSQHLQALEDEARAAKRGLWQDENPTAPWLFRKERKKK